MKKKNILLGILLSGVAISLASCGEKKPTSEPVTSTPVVTTTDDPITSTPTTDPVTSTPVTDPVTSTPVTDPTTSTPDEDTVNVTFNRIEESGKTTVIKTVAVKVGESATPLSDEETAVAGYEFIGWYTTKNATKAYDFTKVLTADTNIYGKYEKIDEAYAAINSSENKIFAYDFNNTTATSTLEGYQLKEVSEGNGSYAFVAGKLQINCSNDSNFDKIALDLEDAPIRDGVVKGCFKLSTSTISSLNFVKFVGAEGQAYEIGATTNGLRYNGSEDKQTPIKADTEYRFAFVMDLVNNKFTVTVDGAETAIKDIAINFTEFNGIEFGGKKSTSLSVTIDNLALEAELASLDEVQAASLNVLDNLYNSYVATDKLDDDFNPLVYTPYNNGKTAVQAATSVSEANAAREAAIAAMNEGLATYRTNKKTEFTNLISDFELDQTKYNALSPEDQAAAYEAYANVVSTYTALIAKATTVLEMSAIYEKAEEKCDYILADKYDITVNFYTKTVTKNEETGEDVVTITKIGDTIYKIAQGKKAVAEDVPGLANYFTLGVFNSEALTTAFDYNTTISDDNTVLYVEVSKTLKMEYTEYNEAEDLNGQVSKYGFFIKTSNGAGIVIGNNAVKYASNGSASDQYVAVVLGAGTYDIAVNGKSGSSGNAAWLQVEAGDQTSKLEFQNSAASVETFTVTLTEETTVYFYRVDGKTVNVYDIAITNKA